MDKRSKTKDQRQKIKDKKSKTKNQRQWAAAYRQQPKLAINGNTIQSTCC
jgi:hypothetical protein